jgi:outer membrane autotransporter protein
MGLVRGTGILPTTAVFGTIWPGNNALGTLSVNGNLAFNPGSSFAVDVAANGQSGKLAVAGATSIAGGSVSVFAAPGAYGPRTRYTILNSPGGVTGAFSGFNASLPSPFLQSSLGYDAQNVYLNLQIGGFAAVAQTPNQYAVGQALDASAPNATGDYATVVTALSQLDPSVVPGILTSLSGQNYSGFSNSMVQGAQLFMSNFLSQAGSGNRGSGRIALAEACVVACDATQETWGAWGGALGGLGTVGQGLGTGAVTYNVGGFAAGLDRKLADNFRAGMTVGYTGGSNWVSGFSGQGFSNTVQAGLYGGFAQGPVYLDGIVGYAYSANQLARSIVIPGLAARQLVGAVGVTHNAIAEATSVYLRYEGDISGQDSSHALTAGVRMTW